MTKKYVPEKSKTTAILLAIFLGHWTWAYTYKYDAVKFWFAMFVALWGWMFLFIPTIMISIYAIVDVWGKDERIFRDYYK